MIPIANARRFLNNKISRNLDFENYYFNCIGIMFLEFCKLILDNNTIWFSSMGYGNINVYKGQVII